jgi:hypothetical protein
MSYESDILEDHYQAIHDDVPMDDEFFDRLGELVEKSPIPNPAMKKPDWSTICKAPPKSPGFHARYKPDHGLPDKMTKLERWMCAFLVAMIGLLVWGMWILFS